MSSSPPPSPTPRSIAILGAGGLLGRRLCAIAADAGWRVEAARSAEVDARDETAVSGWLAARRPDVLFINAAVTGGVHANLASPADYLDANARIALASLAAARRAPGLRVLYAGSAIIYPDAAPQPFTEDAAGSGPLDPTHLGYAAAKLLGVRQCEALRRQDGMDCTALVFTNMYGPGQRYDPARSNVVGGLLRRFHDARTRGDAEVSVWGTGEAERDLLYVDDAARAVIAAAAPGEGPPEPLLNIASGASIRIRELAHAVARTTGFTGRLTFDASKPEGARRRSFDVSRLHRLGWRAQTSLEEGLRASYADFLAHEARSPS